MNAFPNPDNWMDVFTILLVSAMVALPSWLAARNHKTIQAVKDQVVNGHATPMRADLDMMREEIAGIRDELRGGFASIRADLTDEREARRAGDRSLRDEISRHHPPT